MRNSQLSASLRAKKNFPHKRSAFPYNLSAFLVIYLFSLIIHLLSSQSICFPHNPFAFPVGDKLLIGHGWHAWRPQGDMTCLPCLRSRRMVELCRSSTPYRNQQRIPLTTSRKAVELLQSSYTFDASTRQGSRFAPTLPYQAFNPFGVGELWEDIWRVLQRRMAWKEWDLACQGGCMLHTGVSLARRAAEIKELRGCVKIGTSLFFAQSPDFLKPGLCYFPKFL